MHDLPGIPSSDTTRPPEVEGAYTALQNNDTDSAIRTFKKLLPDHPNEPSIFIGLAQSYTRKAQIEHENTYLKFAWDVYVRAIVKDILLKDIIDGIITLGTQLNRFNELILIFKRALTKYPDHDLLKEALSKTTTISMLSIPDSTTSPDKQQRIIVKILFDYCLPLLAIFLFLTGSFSSQLSPHSRMHSFSSLFISAGSILFLIYMFFKFLKAPAVKKRENW